MLAACFHNIEGFFGVPTDHLYARPVLVRKLNELADKDFVVVAPDAGAGPRAKGFAHRLGKHPTVHTYKERGSDGQIEVVKLIGEIHPGQTAVIVDDMIDTGGTIIKVAETLQSRGIGEILAVAVHGVFSGNSVLNLIESAIDKIYFTDTIELPMKEAALISTFDIKNKFVCVSVAELFAEAIRCTHNGESISKLFES